MTLAFDPVPPEIRQHGLCEGHTYPLVSIGKRNGPFAPATRKPAKSAWRYPSIELRSANAWTAVILDCDSRKSVEELHDTITSGELPWPNWITVRAANGNCHAVYALKRPVLRGSKALAKPQLFGANVNEYYRHRLKADPGYTGVMTHNPLPVHRGEIITHWGVNEPYELNQLAKVIPIGWKKPEIATTGIGRNCTLFDACMRWAGSPKNIGFDVLPAAMVLNQDIDDLQGPLPQGEVAGIARSVERYRRIWKARRRFIDLSPEAVSDRQRRRQAKSFVARRAKHADRDFLIVEAFKVGKSQRVIAREFELSQSGVQKIIQRDFYGVV
ncbi:MAG: hypothetical protein GY807_12220 [Gammaproteobacteria bacterium]|nr:hypothetical protein [Gammaproteobacteria bacterium]